MINPMQLTGRKYLITGAASGIGRATAILLSQLGAELILVDINIEGLKSLQSDCATRTQLLSIDLADIAKLRDNVVPAMKNFGKLNGFVHVAGIPYIAPIKSINLEKLGHVFAVNTFAGLELARIFCNKVYYAEKEPCSIVFVSSVYAEVGSPCNAGYAMSKAAIEGLTHSLAMEMASRKIRVNCIAPGFIKTPMDTSISRYFDAEHADVVEALHPLGLGQPEDIANAVAFLVSDAGKWITGTVLHVDGGFTAQ